MPTVADPEVSPVAQATADVRLSEPGLWASWRFHIESKLRSLTRGFVNSFAFFEADLDHTVVSMPPDTQLCPRLFRGASTAEEVCNLLTPMGSSREELQKRMVLHIPRDHRL